MSTAEPGAPAQTAEKVACKLAGHVLWIYLLSSASVFLLRQRVNCCLIRSWLCFGSCAPPHWATSEDCAGGRRDHWLTPVPKQQGGVDTAFSGRTEWAQALSAARVSLTWWIQKEQSTPFLWDHRLRLAPTPAYRVALISALCKWRWCYCWMLVWQRCYYS